MIDRALLNALSALAAKASAVVTAAAIAAPGVRLKADASPVTEADEASEEVILTGLARLMPGVAVVSEEQGAGGETMSAHATFVLVDPLDGTREFIAGRNEFTVNIAIVVDGVPALGVIAAPAHGLLWRGMRNAGAERLAFAGDRLGEPTPIQARKWPAHDAVALTSRSHLDPSTTAFLDRFPGITREGRGSALKFCRLAEGAADIYPRLAPTSEWDVAAGHALLAASGGTLRAPDGSPLAYGNAAGAHIVPGFIAWADPALVARFQRDA